MQFDTMTFTEAANLIQALKKKGKGKGEAEFTKCKEIPSNSPFYQQKIAQQLVKYGILKSKRGPRGGMQLKKQRVTAYDIWEVCIGITTPRESLLRLPYDAFLQALKKEIL